MKILLRPEFQEENSKTYEIGNNEIIFSKWNNAYALKIGESFTVIFQSELEFQQFVELAKSAFFALTEKKYNPKIHFYKTGVDKAK